MSKVIKAHFVSYVEGEVARKPYRFPDSIEVFDENEKKTDTEELKTENVEDTGVTESDLQAAYNELIATAQDEVMNLLDDARAEAINILNNAEQQAGDIKNQAEQAGFEQGVLQAQQEVAQMFEQAQLDCDMVLQRANSVLEAKVRDTQPQILKLSLEVASKILHYELDNNDQAFMSILSNALDNVRDSKKIAIHVSLEEYEKYFNSRDLAKVRTPNAYISVQVVVDPTIQHGGALIDTDSGAIDTSVDAQIGQLANSIGLD